MKKENFTNTQEFINFASANFNAKRQHVAKKHDRNGNPVYFVAGTNRIKCALN
jgi:hypothetical protein